MKNLIFIAPPASGKGTISKYLVDNYGYNHISTGELLRCVAKQETTLGKKIKESINNGEFVSDEQVLEIIKDELINNNKPFILDGIPRNLKQVNYLESLFKEIGVDKYLVINIEINEPLLKMRSIGRRVCNRCRKNYNIYFDNFKPQKEDICDNCNERLLIRADDKEDIFISRYATYQKNTEPVVKYYQEKQLLKTLNGNQEPEKIIIELKNILKEDIND